MEENEYDMIVYENVKSLLLLHVIDNIKSGGLLYAGDNIEWALSQGYLWGLKDFIIESGDFFKWYSYVIKLSDECKEYLKKIFFVGGEGCGIGDFVHYAVFQGERCMMQVFDGICIDIDKSIHIPEWLLKECERNEIWVSFSDHIDVSRY